MAAALSRALKLPGKKGSELGEYDPLTQADSEDESEEDDLVLNYPRNGLGRGNCMGAGPSELRGGRAGRLVGGEEEVEEEDDEEDEWKERLPGRSRQEREEMKGMQYWSQREAGREGGLEDRGGSGGAGGPGLGVGSGADPDGKKAKKRGAIRTAFFLVPLVCAVLLVLLCAFLVPCQKGDLAKWPQWERQLGEDAGGVTLSPLALWDVDGDSVEDVLVGVTERSNDTQASTSSAGNNKVHSVVALSALSGQVLWRRGLREPAVSVQCGLQYEAHPVPLPAGGAALRAYPQTAPLLSGQREQGSGPVCLLIGSPHVTAVNSTTGKELWTVSPGVVESHAVSLPDLQGDTVPDLLIATLPADQVSDLSLVLLSGLTGAPIGHPVTFNLTEQGKLIGPLLHETQMGAYYILFGLGTVEAVSLRDIYTQATGNTPVSPELSLKDPVWEKLKKTNTSSLIHISRGPEQVQVLLPLVAGLCNNHNNLDAASTLNSSRSDWVLVLISSRLSSRLSVLREMDGHTLWSLDSSSIRGRPAPGQFNDDGIPDLLLQSGDHGVRKIQVVDGASGRGLWAAEFVCPDLHLDGSSVTTTSGQSAFLFWAGDPLRVAKNITKATVALAEPVVRKLYLLHPAYPTILLELTHTTDKVLTAAVTYEEQQKDASYIIISSRPTSSPEPGTQVVRSLRLRSAIVAGQIVRLGGGSKGPGPFRPGVFEINKFFRHLSFKQH
ncbi:protein FAM234B [Osmerus eperlanus]|uniref:protein FAM234B n=1 Tax=Osmerus eperlanus TaxID=29151 RepID=UPI002E15F392